MSILTNPSPIDTSNDLEALQQAAKNWDTARIAELLKNGVDCTGTNAAGETVLHFALKNNPSDDFDISKVIETMMIFHNTGVDLNARDKAAKTVLHIAFISKMMKVVKSLIEWGANVNTPDFHGNTIAHYLVESLSNVTSEQFDNWKATYCVDWLLSNDLDVDYKNKNQNTPIHLAAKLDLPEVLLTFVKHSIDINSADNEGRTVFHMLMKHNSNTTKTMEVCEQLLLQGCSVDVTDILGNTTVHNAAKEKKISMLKLMLNSFTNVNAVNDRGETALSALLNVCADETVHQEEGIVDMVASLIDKSTNIYACKKGFLSPVIQLAAECKHAGIFKIVMTREANLGELCNENRLLHHLCMGADNHTKDAEYAEMIDLLVSKGGDVNNKNILGMTPLYLAAQSATTAVVQKLIENRADVHSREPNGLWTPLHVAVKSHRFETINSLVDAKADINAKDSKGRMPLHHAASSCTSKMTELLLELGADVEARDNKGRSPLYYAVGRYNLTVIENLLKYGADVCDPAVFNRVVRLERNKALACLMEHWYTMKIAKMKVVRYYEEYEYNLSLEFLNQCAREIKTLKTTYIDNSTTFYKFLHMNRNCRCAYTNDDKFCKLCESTELAKKFPRYHVLILALYHQAVKRKSLLKVASRDWYGITKVRLPDVCLYNIFDNLVNKELKCLNLKNAGVIAGLKRCVSCEKAKFFPLAKEIKRRRH